jgi:colanic acid biosynthesis glycosyl transferase WcaI
MAKRILLLTQWFDPEPTFKGMVFARELVTKGYEVEVITGFPNYPGGKLYPGYKIQLLQRECIDSVNISRVPLYPSHDGSAIKRILNYISFAMSVIIYGVFVAKKADIIYAYHPPLTTGVAAVIIRFFRRIPIVYDIQDMWPDTLRATGMVSNEKILSIVSYVCQWVYKHVDKIIVLSPGFERLLIERGISPNKVDVIYNWCDEKSLNSPVSNVPDEFPPAEKFTILFAGTMGKAQSLDSVISAAKIVQSQQPNINFVFVGGGIEVDRLKEIVENNQLDNVTFIPKVPMNRIGAMLKQADVLLVHLKNDPLFEITIPSKIQAYLAVGKPVLVGVMGDAADIVKQANCGLVATPENPQSIADAAMLLASSSADELKLMGQRGKDFYDKKMSVKVGVASFAKSFDILMKATNI